MGKKEKSVVRIRLVSAITRAITIQVVYRCLYKRIDVYLNVALYSRLTSNESQSSETLDKPAQTTESKETDSPLCKIKDTCCKGCN